MKKIFEAWQVKISDYPNDQNISLQIRFLLRFAVLAPSAHNTQPWLFAVEENKIFVYLDKTRVLGLSDPTTRQTYVSMGAMIFNILCAASYFGFSTQVDYLPHDNAENLKSKLLAVINLSKSGQGGKSFGDLLPYISKRHSAKLAYLDNKLSSDQIGDVSHLSSPGMELKFFFNKEDIVKMAEIVYLGTREAFANNDFCIELSQWVRSSWSDRLDGMPAVTVGVPAILSGLIPWAIAHLDTGKMQARDAGKLVANTPGIGIIGVAEENQLSWLRAGELFEQTALTLKSIGFDCALMGAPTESATASARLKSLAKLNSFPALFFRFGVSQKPVLFSPRRDADQCIINHHQHV
ncbi:MAG: hypothetical protein WCT40_02970 [Candidatus Magasanikbacteria bacterium]|jgi:hypothetical protein